MTKTSGYAGFSATAPLAPFSFERRDVGPRDVQIDILYCGVCHSDLHTVRNEWMSAVYPLVPGHEIIGRVAAVGSDVTEHAVGQIAAVGCFVDSCRTCAHCHDGLEQHCDGMVFTYNSPDPQMPGLMTYGGYSKQIVVEKRFVFSVPDGLDPAAAAPLLCAGITTYSPLRHWEVGPNSKVGIVGLGGLGHMGVKLSHALGAHTVLFTTSPGKTADARRLGADEVVISRNEDEMLKHANSFDFILDTVSAPHSLDAFTTLLKRDSTLCLVGVPAAPHPSPNVFPLIFKRRSIAGSLVGGTAETQDMLDFCGRHRIVADVEMIRIDQVDEAYERMLRSDVNYRFVIDMGSLA